VTNNITASAASGAKIDIDPFRGADDGDHLARLQLHLRTDRHQLDVTG
jgi:hypothetical protein